MLPLPVFWVVIRLIPDLVPGRILHRRALASYASGALADAEQWFEAAAGRYRRELAVEPLARLRVHQLMARAHAGVTAAGEATAMIEIVRRLNRLDQLEQLHAPFALTDARGVLAEWIESADAVPAPSRGIQPVLAHAA